MGCVSFLFTCPISAPRDSCSPLQTHGQAQPSLSLMLPEPGWIPSGRAGSGTQEQSGTVSCQRWHLQAGSARAEESRLGPGLIPNRSWLCNHIHAQPSVPSPACAQGEPSPAGHSLALPAATREGQHRFVVGIWWGRARPVLARMDRTKSGVGVEKPCAVPDCSRSTWDPRACGGNGNQQKGKDPRAAQLWASNQPQSCVGKGRRVRFGMCWERAQDGEQQRPARPEEQSAKRS